MGSEEGSVGGCEGFSFDEGEFFGLQLSVLFARLPSKRIVADGVELVANCAIGWYDQSWHPGKNY